MKLLTTALAALTLIAGAATAGDKKDVGTGVGVESSRSVVQRRPVDCHRDVRTHRIWGVLIRHRHVGTDCRVREVRTSTLRPPKS